MEDRKNTSMGNIGIKTIIYPVEDLERAKALFKNLTGVEPYADSSYYVGFRIGDQEFGLDPNGHKWGMTSYHHVDNIEQKLQSLVDAGAQIEQEIKDVGKGTLIAVVKDKEGNIIGLRQSP
jgi:predicted enzyme related to lactoylglutathione lyase